VWDAETGTEIITLVGHTEALLHGTWNRDGSRILTAGDDRTARVWNADNGEELVTLIGHEQAIVQATWNADESLILTAGGDDTTRVWDAKTGTVLAILAGHSEAVLDARWNADESRILTASGDGTARQWYARIADLIAAACQRTPRNMTPEEWRHFIGDAPYRSTCPNLPQAQVRTIHEETPEAVSGQATAENGKITLYDWGPEDPSQCE